MHRALLNSSLNTPCFTAIEGILCLFNVGTKRGKLFVKCPTTYQLPSPSTDTFQSLKQAFRVQTPNLLTLRGKLSQKIISCSSQRGVGARELSVTQRQTLKQPGAGQGGITDCIHSSLMARALVI